MNQGKSLKLIGYVRVSTKGQAETGISPEVQRKQITNYCEQHGHELLGIETDDGYSAGTLDRPGLKIVLKYLSDPTGYDCDGLVVAKLDRLTRSVAHWCELFANHFHPDHWGKCKLFSCNEQVDVTTAQGRFMLYINFGLAELELDRTTERTVDSVEHKRAAGHRLGTIPYGFKLDPNGNKSNRGKLTDLIPDPDEQLNLLQMQIWHANGDTYAKIADMLNTCERPTRSGRPWSRAAVHSLLTRPKLTNANQT